MQTNCCPLRRAVLRSTVNQTLQAKFWEQKIFCDRQHEHFIFQPTGQASTPFQIEHLLCLH